MLASLFVIAGALSWLIKLGIIVATDGRIITTGPAAFLMSTGLVLLPLGAAIAGAWMARRSHAVVRALAAIGSAAGLMAICVMLGVAGSRIFEGYGPAYLAEEIGMLFAGLLWLTVGIIGLRAIRGSKLASNARGA